MNKCFITKLPSSVDNDNLPVLGQLRINWLKQDNLTNNNARAIGLAANDNIVVKVSGAHLTDNTLASNLGNTKTITAADGMVWLYVSNDADATLTIDNKYALTQINVIRQPGDEGLVRSLSFDLDDIEYCTNLTWVSLYNTQVTGDISALSKLTNLQQLILPNAQVSGNISALSKLTNINVLILSSNPISGDISVLSNFTNARFIDLGNTQVGGDISALSNLTNLNTLYLQNTKVIGNLSAVSNLTKLVSLLLNNTSISGDISAVSNLTNLSRLTISNTQISGNVDSLTNLTKLTDLTGMQGLSLTGDMSKIPTGVNFISQKGRKVNTNFTWTANGRQNATLLAMEGVPFDTASMDNMLIDQATCTLKATESMPWTKSIFVSGNRTSSSDAAVTALQNMGVTIIGVTKQA